jgi:hypothetical protein
MQCSISVRWLLIAIILSLEKKDFKNALIPVMNAERAI